MNIGNRLHRQQVERNDGAVDTALGLAGALRQLVPGVLAPTARRRAEIDDDLAWLDQLVLLVDFLEFVSSARAIPLALRHFYVGIVDVIVKPILIETILCHGIVSLRRTIDQEMA